MEEEKNEYYKKYIKSLESKEKKLNSIIKFLTTNLEQSVQNSNDILINYYMVVNACKKAQENASASPYVALKSIISLEQSKYDYFYPHTQKIEKFNAKVKKQIVRLSAQNK